MKTQIITERQIGLLFKNGKFVKMLRAGKYTTFGNSEIEVKELSGSLYSSKVPLKKLISDEQIRNITNFIEVPDGKIALRFADGMFDTVLESGKYYAYFNALYKNRFEIYDIDIDLADKLAPEIIEKLKGFFKKVEVPMGSKGLLYVNKELNRVLDTGTYFYPDKFETLKVECEIIDMRLRQLNVQSQEILTADKATVRVNFSIDYKIMDPVKMKESVESYAVQLYSLGQLAVREYVGKQKLDDFLEGKDEIASYIMENMKGRCEEFYVEIVNIGVKDLILPGEVRDIMKTVLLAEKKAQANVITRREEVASTRSLLNTAKMMEDNPTLYKLKELEYVERICESVGSINISGREDILTQLTGLMTKGDKGCS